MIRTTSVSQNYDALCSKRNLSATMTMNFEFVGFALDMKTVYLYPLIYQPLLSLND
jgi:hypothetical protein